MPHRVLQRKHLRRSRRRPCHLRHRGRRLPDLRRGAGESLRVRPVPLRPRSPVRQWPVLLDRRRRNPILPVQPGQLPQWLLLEHRHLPPWHQRVGLRLWRQSLRRVSLRDGRGVLERRVPGPDAALTARRRSVKGRIARNLVIGPLRVRSETSQVQILHGAQKARLGQGDGRGYQSNFPRAPPKTIHDDIENENGDTAGHGDPRRPVDVGRDARCSSEAERRVVARRPFCLCARVCSTAWRSVALGRGFVRLAQRAGIWFRRRSAGHDERRLDLRRPQRRWPYRHRIGSGNPRGGSRLRWPA